MSKKFQDWDVSQSWLLPPSVAELVSADAGYCSEENLQQVNRKRVNAYIDTGRQKHGTSSQSEGTAGSVAGCG